jgi:hypothetical protein
MFGIPTELATMGISAIAGFVFRYMAERAKERKEILSEAIEALKVSDASRDAAAERGNRADGATGGTQIRRFLVVSVIFAIIFAPFVLSFISIPTVVELTHQTGGFLGLGKKTVTEFVEINGFLIAPEVRSCVPAIIGFYFGQAIGQKS